ncbi:MAG TPA: GAF domain-containing protein [Anaerolineae bacterium]|nr:GAF domain-containing protein [Anaerolineae bacterium]
MADISSPFSTSLEPPVPRYARPLVIASLLIAAAVYLVAPLVAYDWVNRVPFLGVALEQTFNVNDSRGATWGPSPTRLDLQDHIQAIKGRVIDSQAALEQALIAVGVGGDQVAQVTYRQRTAQGAPIEGTLSLRLTPFPASDLLRLFWLPYLIGLAYLGIGLWVFRLRGQQRAGLAFTFFSAWVAIALGILFDMNSTHRLAELWPWGLALSGGAMFHLAFVFPQEPRSVAQRPALRLLSYIPAAALALYARTQLYDLSDPWAYIGSWQLLYVFMVIGLLFFYGMLIYRRLASTSPVARQQSRIILWGSALAFLPFGLWAIVGVLGFVAPFDPLFYLPTFIFFPLAIAYALLRYRLLDIDLILNRTLVYVLVTGLVVGAYFLIVAVIGALAGSTQSLMSNPALLAAFVLATAVLLDRLRKRVQLAVDRVFFRTRIDVRGVLQSYSHDLTGAADLASIVTLLRNVVSQTLNPDPLRVYLHDARTRSYQLHLSGAERGKLPPLVARCPADNPLARWMSEQRQPWYVQPDRPLPRPIYNEGARIEAMGGILFVPLHGRYQLNGWVSLGAKLSGHPYTTDDMSFLSALADQTTLALERALTYTDLERRVTELNALSQISQAVNFSVDPDAILELIYAQTGKVLDTANFYIALADLRRGTLRFAFYVENGERLYPDDEWPLEVGLTGEIVRAGQPIITDDYVQECVKRGILPGGKPGRAWMGVPLYAGDHVLGVMNVSSFDPGVTYSDDQLHVFAAIADQAASVLDKIRLYQKTEERARQLAVLNEVSTGITSSLDLRTVLNTIMEKAVEILDAEAGSLLLVDDKRSELVFEVILGPAAEKLAGARLPLGKGIVGAVAESGRPQIVNEAQTDTRWLRDVGQTDRFITRALLTVPMRARDKVVGVIQLLNKKDGTPFDEDDQTLLEAFAGNAAIAVENAQLFSRTDLALARRVEELSTLQEIDRELNVSLDFNRVMDLTLKWGLSVSGAEAGSIGMIDREQNELLLLASRGYASDCKTLPLEAGLAAKSMRIGLPLLLDDATPDPESAPASPGTQSQISVPIRRGSEVVGVLNLESARSNAFGATEFESAIRLADHAAVAITNARLYEEVKRANDAKSEFVSVVSHELKTPMTSIKGYTDLVIKGAAGPLTELQQQFLNTVRTNVERMSTLVGDLLEISRIETGRLKLDIKPVSMGEVIEETLRTTQRQIEEKQQALDVTVPKDLPQVLGDRARLIQVMTNLISNAYKYTPTGGQIFISAQPQLNGSPPFVMCAIKDTGVGISPEDQAKLFTKFFRSGDPAVREVPGTGLGLSITKSLIELHGGQIWVESQLGKGTTFAFTVPVARQVAA